MKVCVRKEILVGVLIGAIILGTIAFIAAGATEKNNQTSDSEWINASSLQYPDVGYAHTYNEEIYFVGGDYVQVYNCSTNNWSVVHEGGIGYQPWRGGSALVGDRIYIVHGWSEALYYNITTNQFVNFPSPNLDRLDVAVGAVNGIIYVSGGWSSGRTTSTTNVEAYNPNNNTWYEVAPMSIGRKYHEMIGIGGYLYAIAGITGSGWAANVHEVERYDPISNQWEMVASTSNTYRELGATARGDKIVISKGDTEVYDIINDTWSSGPTSPFSDFSPAVEYLDGGIYSIGGRTAPGGYLSAVYKWDGNGEIQNQLPEACINSIIPTPASQGTNITFTGQGSDTDGTIIAYHWESSINGFLGNQSSFVISTLSVGAHTIYFKVQDNDGNWSVEDSATLEITLLPHNPIYINGNSDFASQASSEGWAGNGTEGNPYIIENYDINASSAHGIEIKNTNGYFIIRNCIIHDGSSNYNYGIYFHTVTNGKIDNVISHSNYHGIWLFPLSDNNIITNCTVYENSVYGIYLSSSSCNEVTYCTVYNNSWAGIGLEGSSNNRIEKCVCYNNCLGIRLYGSSNNNLITNNIAYNNSYGIELYLNSYDNKIINCTVHNNGWGINVYFSSHDNQITCCNIIDNTVYGVEIFYYVGDYPSDCNLFYQNNFINNAQHVYDECTNYWDNGTEGNYWSDYTGIDNDGDGIGDTPYYVSGKTPPNQDNYPFMNPIEHIPPTVESTSPSNGDIDVSVDTTITIIFSESINKLSVIGNITIAPFVEIDYYDWSNNNKTVTLILLSNLSSYTNYTITITTNVKDLSQNNLQAPYVFFFKTKDITPPIIANIQAIPQTQEIYGYVKMTAFISDNAMVNKVYVNITHPNGTLLGNFSMPSVGLDANRNGTHYYNITYSVLGTYSYYIWADDVSNNWNKSEEKYFLIRDSTCPIANAGLDKEVNEDVEVELNASLSWDNAGIVNYIWNFTDNGEDIVLYDEIVHYTFNQPDYYVITLNVSDAAGNWALDIVNITVKDVTPPIIMILSPENNTIKNQNITLVYCVYDNFDDIENITVTGPENNTVYDKEREYTVTINATDTAGNNATQTITFTIDKTNPIITISGVADGAYYNTDVAPLVDVSDTNLDTTSITLNGNPFINGTTISAENTYTLVVQATDKAGNTANKTLIFTIDKTAPTITIAESSHTINKNSFTTHWSASEAVQYYEVSTDGVNWENVTMATQHIFTLSKGDNTLYVRGTDFAGNKGIADMITVTYQEKKGKPGIIPGFDFFFLLGGISVAMLIWRKHQKHDTV